VADKRCENGHFIDESWDICPYCPQDQSEPEIPVVRPRAVEPAPARAVPAGGGVAAIADASGTGGRGGHRPTSSAALAAVQPPPMERTVAAAQASAQKRYVVAWLVGLSGAARGRSFPVRMGRIIGRDRRSDIVIQDEQASSHHADLVFRRGETVHPHGSQLYEWDLRERGRDRAAARSRSEGHHSHRRAAFPLHAALPRRIPLG
jgi:hypothetical protein